MRFILLLIATSFILTTTPASAEEGLYLEDMTWSEIQDRIAKGNQTVLIPTGGTEQNGPHIALGKHNWIAAYTANVIARQLGGALVAPVIAFVPEGTITPPEGHMRFPGTLSVREEIYEGLLEDTARSLKQAGFTTICFIGDSGGNQQGQKNVAAKLNAQWRGKGTYVLHVSDYYSPKAADEYASLHSGGAQPQAHGGFMDTAETLAVRPAAVRHALAKDYSAANQNETGTTGNAKGATAEYGKALLKYKIDAAVAQIRKERTLNTLR
jgi:creatinine amidohydrolase/Fe(II)-dependent formamide hydrolase-like protein